MRNPKTASETGGPRRPLCIGCNRPPGQIPEYVRAAKRHMAITPNEFVRQNEGTYNPQNGHFLCSACYLAAGMPSSPEGWIAP